MKTYIVDIETKPQASLIDLFNQNIQVNKNIKDEKKIEEALEKKKNESIKAMSVDTDFADIFCIGVKELGKEPQLINLKEFSELLKEQVRIVTYNGKNFDLPIIIKQGIKQNIKMPYKEIYQATQRYSKSYTVIEHIDLMELIGEYGKWKSLDMLLQIYLGIKKKEIAFSSCSDEELRKHCLEDLINTEKLYNLFIYLI